MSSSGPKYWVTSTVETPLFLYSKNVSAYSGNSYISSSVYRRKHRANQAVLPLRSSWYMAPMALST